MSVTRHQVDAICGTLPGAVLAHPPELISWKVGGKMFACVGQQDSMDGVSVKTADTETARMLIDTTGAIKAKYFHTSWVRLPYDTVALDEVNHRVVASYDIIRGTLKKAERDALPERKAH